MNGRQSFTAACASAEAHSLMALSGMVGGEEGKRKGLYALEYVATIHIYPKNHDDRQ